MSSDLESIDQTPLNHPEHAGLLRDLQATRDLGAIYQSQYLQTENIDLDTFIQQLQESVNQTSLDHPERAERLRELGAGYYIQYTHTGNLTDLNTAIKYYQDSVN